MRRTDDCSISKLEQEEVLLSHKLAELRALPLPTCTTAVISEVVEVPERLLSVRSQLNRAASRDRNPEQTAIRAERVQDARRSLLEMYNWLATKLLQDGSLKNAFDLLQRAEAVIKTHKQGNDSATAITYNNIACYYRRIGKLRAAVHLFGKGTRNRGEDRMSGRCANAFEFMRSALADWQTRLRPETRLHCSNARL